MVVSHDDISLSSQVVAYSIFASYFILILTSFSIVIRSILHNVAPKRLLEGTSFLFLRVAIGALLCTWYFMIEYMKWSYKNFAVSSPTPTIAKWLHHTALFEQAWSIVCTGADSWWWSSWICTWTVLFTAIVWSESEQPSKLHYPPPSITSNASSQQPIPEAMSRADNLGGRRGIKYPWAYMLLGQLVAMSVSTALFVIATSLHPRRYSTKSLLSAPQIVVPLGVALGTIWLNPEYVGTKRFLPNLLVMHGALLPPLVFPPRATDTAIRRTERTGREEREGGEGQDGESGSALVYLALIIASALVHVQNAIQLAKTPGRATFSHLCHHILTHPAQASISMDVIWVAVTLACWFLTTGSFLSIMLKSTVLLCGLSIGVTSYTGVNWALVVSILPIVCLGMIGVIALGLSRLRSRNESRRKSLLESMGIKEDGMIPGTDKEPPKMVGRKMIVGFWHPYCNAGGGGERVLWTAIAWLQREHPDVISLVYSGDYPSASKEEILAKVKDRFSIILSSSTLNFVPLPSRHLVSDTYWRRFTLLGQSLGSIYLAWQGICGKDGLWGDIFIDSMGYAFTLPFVRLVGGPEVTLGAYVHYPTVSSDMVDRVRKGVVGVENRGSKSWLRTQVKLVYYYLFTSVYSVSLLFPEHIMTNSTWTQRHVLSLLAKGRKSILAGILLMDDKTLEKRGEGEKVECRVVYPPCDTTSLIGLGGLDKRERMIVSLAQFRPEKEQAKQIQALAILFEHYPQHRTGESRVTMTLMGGARHPADEARVEGLKVLARELGVESNVDFLVNAPYSEIVQRLGRASIGMDTMQDEHFGINVVEFMAAGLIPIVHASAGPYLDIVTPYEGTPTGLHAQGRGTEEFAKRIQEILTMSPSQQMSMRTAGRKAAVERFSEAEFERGFKDAWDGLVRRSRNRRRYDR